MYPAWEAARLPSLLVAVLRLARRPSIVLAFQSFSGPRTAYIPIMSNNPVLLFVIVGRNEPLYEAEFHKRGGVPNTPDATTRQNYFVLHSALDLVERSAWTTNRMHLGVIDKVNNQQVSTFLTAGNVKFMLLHSGRSDDAIRNFFQEVYELYVKVGVAAISILSTK